MGDDNMNCNYNVVGINAQFGYKSDDNNFDCDNKCDKKEMLKEIQSLYFAVTELALYLNTHPTDEKALCLHKNYANKLKDIKEKYEKTFGPLSICTPCDKWKWLKNPWPWERSEI